MISKLTGYIIAAVGLVIIVLSFKSASIPILTSIKPAFIMIAGIVVIILGVALTLGKGKVKQAEEEVPIYRGKKIVGYRKAA